MSKFRIIHILFVLFLVSILIRLPNLNRPISKHHEFNTAFFLIPMEIWSEKGASSHGFLPPYNYSNPGDFGIPEPIAISAGQKEGRFYYLSLPPLSYIVPYVIFESLQLEFSPLNLQLFNLLLHALVVLLLFKVLALLYREKIALWAVSIYLFAPGPLWFHGNGYTHHVFALLPLLSATYFLLKYIQAQNLDSTFLLGFAFSAAALVYSEWIGVLFIVTVFILSVFKFKTLIYRRIAIVSAIVGIISLSLLLFQYNSFMGWDQYKAYMLDRFLQRSGADSETYVALGIVVQWVYWSMVSYGLWVPCLLIGTFMLFKSKIVFLPNEKLILLLFTVPVFVYHLIFSEFTFIHEYSVLYNGLIWTLLSAILLNHFHWKITSWRGSIFTGLILFLFVAQYYFINRIGDVGQNGDRYDQLMVIGHKIRDKANPDETVFLLVTDESIDRVNPIVNYYAKRNFVPIKNFAEIEEKLIETERTDALILTIEKGGVVEVWRKQIERSSVDY